MPILPDGRPLSTTRRVNDVQGTDAVVSLRLNEADPADQNVLWTVARLTAYLSGQLAPAGGTGGTPLPANVTAALLAAGSPAGTNAFLTEADRPTAANNQRGGPFFLRTYSPADPNYVTGETALSTLDYALVCIASTAAVEFGPDGYHQEYEAIYDPASTALCYPTGAFKAGAQTVPFRWVLKGSARAGLRDYTEYAAGFVFPAGTFVAAYVSGQTAEQLFKRRAPGGAAPAPTNGGDVTYWEPAAIADVPTGNAIPLTGTVAGHPVTGAVKFTQAGSLVFYDAANDYNNEILTQDGLVIHISDATTGTQLAYFEFLPSGGFRTDAGVTLFGPVVNVNAALTAAANGDLLVNGRPAGAPLPVALAYAATIALDFNAAPVRTLAATGNVAFTTVNRFAGGLKTVYLKNTTAAAITLSYEAWVVFGTALPTSLAAGKELILTLTCLGTTVSDVKAAAVLSN